MSRGHTNSDASKFSASMAMLVTSVVSPVLGMIVYVFTRVFTQRREGKSWSQVFADGEKPITGSIWLDAVLFFFILVLVGAAVVLFMFWD